MRISVRGFTVVDNKAQGGGFTLISVCNPSGNKIQNSKNAATNKLHKRKDNARDEQDGGGCLVGRSVCQLLVLLVWLLSVAACAKQVNRIQLNSDLTKLLTYRQTCSCSQLIERLFSYHIRLYITS